MPIDTLYFGGGTPSHLGADGVRALLDVMRDFYTWTSDAEVTLEANPDDVTPLATRAWRDAGVRACLSARRVLMMACWDGCIARIRPIRSIAPVDIIRDTPFDSWSFDLIFAIPASLNRDWQRDLDLALGKRPPHLSLYGLTVEEGTPLGKWTERGEVDVADEQSYETQFLGAHRAAVSAGFDHYEVSNFAQPGHHARHNRSYWKRCTISRHRSVGARIRWHISAVEPRCLRTMAGRRAQRG